jgi:hypothetical protein
MHEREDDPVRLKRNYLLLRLDAIPRTADAKDRQTDRSFCR